MRVRIVILLVVLTAVSGCGIRRIDAPVSFKAEHRLDVQSPQPDAEVGLPIEVTWTADTKGLTKGVHFGVFVDRVPVGPDKPLRLRVCTEREKLPPQAGSFRKLCKDDRLTIFFTRDTDFTFDCFVPRFSAPERVRNTHRVSVVLLDEDERRVGQAVSSVQFKVDAEDARRCRGV